MEQFTITTLEEVKSYLRVDSDDDDAVIKVITTAAFNYLKKATGKEYPEADGEGNIIDYSGEKLFIWILCAYWYEHRDMIGKNTDAISEMTRSLILQLQL